MENVLQLNNQRVRVEILCDEDLVERLSRITIETGASRNFLIRKAIRLYLDNRDRSSKQGAPG